MELVTDVYEITRQFPRDEVYGLTSQLRRAAVSVPSNLAEGYERNSRKNFHRFLGQALGSLLELETQLEIAANLKCVSHKEVSELLPKTRRVAQLLNGLKSWCDSADTPTDRKDS